MAHVILFHSALGLRPGVHSFAEQFRKVGYAVTTTCNFAKNGQGPRGFSVRYFQGV